MSQLDETFPSPPSVAPHAPRPTARQWALHGLLFLVTAVTTTLCGIWFALGNVDVADGAPPETSGIAGSILLIPWYYVRAVAEMVRLAFAQPQVLEQGLIFSGCLLAILTAHEFGHYLFCRYYGVYATLPVFIPQPPVFVAGAFGA